MSAAADRHDLVGAAGMRREGDRRIDTRNVQEHGHGGSEEARCRHADSHRGSEGEADGRVIYPAAKPITETGGVVGPHYAASKAGMVGMSKSLAYEVASRGITVNCVAPGFITTAMTDKLTDDQKSAILTQVPAGRMGEAAEIGAAHAENAMRAVAVAGQLLDG